MQKAEAIEAERDGQVEAGPDLHSYVEQLATVRPVAFLQQRRQVQLLSILLPEKKTVRSLVISMLMPPEDDWQALAPTAAEETAKGILQVRQQEMVQAAVV
jgi:hypothetical protein